MNPYEKLHARKRKWTPVQTTAGLCKEGAEETVLRALALRHMELPVGDFITDALEKNVPTAARKLCLLYTSPSPRDLSTSRMPSSA